jgi:hypothetical protein
MHAMGANRVFRRLAATAGLLLILVATAAGADPLDADAEIAAANQASLADVPATEVDSSISALVDASDASKDSASTGAKLAGKVDDAGAFLGQLVTQYFEHYN